MFKNHPKKNILIITSIVFVVILLFVLTFTLLKKVEETLVIEEDEFGMIKEEKERNIWLDFGDRDFGFEISYPERIKEKNTEFLFLDDESEGDWKKKWLLFDSVVAPEESQWQGFRNRITLEAIKFNNSNSFINFELNEKGVFTYSGETKKWISEKNLGTSYFWGDVLNYLKEVSFAQTITEEFPFFQYKVSNQERSERLFGVFIFKPPNLEEEELYFNIKHEMSYPEDFDYLRQNFEGNEGILELLKDEYNEIGRILEEIIFSARFF